MKLIKNRWWRMAIFGFIGAIAGYAYYYYIGCRTGTCAITSNPYISTGYGAMVALLLSWSGKKEKAK